ncbi:hypothetical protein BKP35_03740 [Anaerobacillus arseniciselenatis]|uniref:serine-type D-Ala-D-Ala carboxypeptidase n=1 Tax=Anaerobacillus arseniciselenatis TaxID=85682 RepID=A0A1S2LUU8_9BACI|nr:penicillin-binding protein 2 [Anaerobacillus arseniciselenatis]OIJ16104.1 hypothetical protein BKP35_03740 [Anaerobacillus arseniciselenatis]
MSKKKKKTHIPIRLNILFFVVFLLFSALILRLGVVQIVQGEQYQQKLERTVNVIAKNEAPRGIMYDRNGHAIVENRLVLMLTYTNRNVSNDEKLRVARRLNELIEVDTSKVTERDMKDYWILTYPEEAVNLVSQEEIAELDNDHMAVYRLQLDRISEEHLEQLSTEDMEIISIKREFDRGFAHTPQRVTDVTYVEAARVLEHLSELPGVDIIRDAERNYVYGNSFRQIFGNVGSIQRDNVDYYLSRGYYRSDQVGTSQLEQQYEDVLRGEKEVLEHVLDGSGRLIDQPIETPGQRGNDLVLTLDMELQQSVEQIVIEEIDRLRSIDGYVGVPAAYALMLEPHTGEILAMSGFRENNTTGELTSYELGNVYNSFEMGSAVKGATILTGFEAGVVSPGQIINDRTIDIRGTRISSHTTMGRINDLTALERSSNVYMAEIALALGGTYNRATNSWSGNIPKGYNIMRYYFNQLGLGIRTGIDLPSEGSGFNGGIQEIGNLAHLSYGQFDTYTPLQTAQYTATIANGGYRIQPRLVREIREPSTVEGELGNVVKQFSPNVLNRVDMNDDYIERVQEGFRLVVHGSQGTARALANNSFKVAGKTGTSQLTFVRDAHNNVIRDRNGQAIRGNNQIFVGYAPYDNPEVAFVVIVPDLKIDDSRGSIGIGRPANTISGNILDAYFGLENDRNGPRLPNLEEEIEFIEIETEEDSF